MRPFVPVYVLFALLSPEAVEGVLGKQRLRITNARTRNNKKIVHHQANGGEYEVIDMKGPTGKPVIVYCIVPSMWRECLLITI
jgi:hypothetical protein